MDNHFSPTVRYTVMDGEIVSESRNGTIRDYVPDPLGSTIALLDQNQNITDTFSYWPYGEERTRTGTTPTPFRFVGTLGYYRDSSGRTYVRAREYQQTYGRWMTQDSPRTAVDQYSYGDLTPTVLTDASGRMPVQGGTSVRAFPAELTLCSNFAKGLTQQETNRINGCISSSLRPGMSCPNLSDPIQSGSNITIANCLAILCSRQGSFKLVYDDPSVCCKPDSPPARSWRKRGEPCMIVLCTAQLRLEGARDLGGDRSIPPYFFNFLHELLHCCGVQHGSGQPWEECNDVIACCIYNVIRGQPGDEKKCKRHPP